MGKFIINPKKLSREDVNGGWDMTWKQVVWENRKDIFKFFNRYKKWHKQPKPPKKKTIHNNYIEWAMGDVHLSVTRNTPQIEQPKQDLEYLTYLQNQTPEQFALAQKHGWRIARLLTEPEKNFHEE